MFDSFSVFFQVYICYILLSHCDLVGVFLCSPFLCLYMLFLYYGGRILIPFLLSNVLLLLIVSIKFLVFLVFLVFLLLFRSVFADFFVPTAFTGFYVFIWEFILCAC